MSPWLVEPLCSLHSKADFDCGYEALNGFIQQYAGQQQKRHLSKTYVAVSTQISAKIKPIAGFYTLTSGQITTQELPQSHKYPKHPIAIARLARLAGDKRYQGQGLGAFLLYDALKRVLQAEAILGIYAVVVDAKDDRAKAFYQHYGFEVLQNQPLTLFLPIKTLLACVAGIS